MFSVIVLSATNPPHEIKPPPLLSAEFLVTRFSVMVSPQLLIPPP